MEAQTTPATGDGYDPISPLVAAAALGETSIVELLLPKYRAHVDRAAVAAAGGRPNGNQSSATIVLLSQQSLQSFAGYPTLNFALGIAILRNQTAVVSWLNGHGVNSIPPAFTVALNNPMNTIDDQLRALGVSP
jgi:hypothetical protein